MDTLPSQPRCHPASKSERRLTITIARDQARVDRSVSHLPGKGLVTVQEHREVPPGLGECIIV
jgi:hypothetical protein